MAAPRPHQTTAADLLEVLFRRRLLVLAVPTVVLGIGLLIALFGPRSYRSEAKLCLQVGRESVNIDPTAATGQQTISLQQMGRDSEIKSAIELMISRGVAAQVVDRLGPEFILNGAPTGESGGGETNRVAAALDATVGKAIGSLIAAIKSIDPISEREEAILEIEDNLVVDAERDSVLINLTYATKTPIGAQRVLETLIDVYEREHLRIYRNEGSREFSAGQEALWREQLDQAMQAVRRAKDKIGVASIESRRTNLEAQLQSITMARFNAQTERRDAEASLADTRRQLLDMPQRLISSKKQLPNEGADLLRDQLYALQVRQAELRSRYSETHPLVLALSSQVEEAEKVVDQQSSLREETIDDVNPIHRDLSLAARQQESVLAGLDARLKTLERQEADVRAEMAKLNADEVRLAQLERERSVAQANYFRYTENLEQARINEELQNERISSISLAQAPTLSEKPASPSKLLVGLGSIVLAFAGTAGLVLGLEQMSDRLLDERSIEQAVGAPVLATIPDSPAHGRVLVP